MLGVTRRTAIGWQRSDSYAGEAIDVPELGLVRVEAGPPLADQRRENGTWAGEALVRRGHLEDGRPVVVKTRFDGRSPGRRDAAGWCRERDTCQTFNLQRHLPSALPVPEMLGLLDELEEGRLHLVLEAMPGDTFSNLARADEQIGIELVAETAHQLCDFVARCHELGIALVELNPGSILLDAGDDEMRCSFIDFGQSRVLGDRDVILETNPLLPPHIRDTTNATEARDAVVCAVNINWMLNELAREELATNQGRALKAVLAVFTDPEHWPIIQRSEKPVRVLQHQIATATHSPAMTASDAAEAAKQALVEVAQERSDRRGPSRSPQLLVAGLALLTFSLLAGLLAVRRAQTETATIGPSTATSGMEPRRPGTSSSGGTVTTDTPAETIASTETTVVSESPAVTGDAGDGNGVPPARTQSGGAPANMTTTTAALKLPSPTTARPTQAAPVTTAPPAVAVTVPPTTIKVVAPCYQYPGNQLKPQPGQTFPYPIGSTVGINMATASGIATDTTNPYHISYDLYEIDPNCNRFRSGTYNAGPGSQHYWMTSGNILQVVPNKDITVQDYTIKAGDALETYLLNDDGLQVWIPPCC